MTPQEGAKDLTKDITKEFTDTAKATSQNLQNVSDRLSSVATQATDKAMDKASGVYEDLTENASKVFDQATTFVKDNKGIIIGALTAVTAIGLLTYLFSGSKATDKVA
jgi:ElaB/YqjD/DUF883 family membrane-anchored ribosome-binding protein